MSIDPCATGATYLSDQLTRGLLLGQREGLSDFLICDNSHGKFAIGLDGHARFRVIELSGVNNAWRGCFIDGVDLVVDQASWFTTHARDPRPGDVVLCRSKVWIAVEAPLGSSYHLVEWAPALSLGQGEITGGFSNWRLVKGPEVKRVELRSITSQKVSVEVLG